MERANWIGLVTRNCLNLSDNCRGTELGLCGVEQRPSLCSQYRCRGGFPPEQGDVFQEQNRIAHEDTNT